MQKDIRISVIVPIFNVREYLDNCISSICNQTYKNIEIILVDDGSTDGCHEICDAYKDKDKRIIVIHQENKGQSEARKIGIKQASGQYVCFVDGDDIIEPNMCELLYTTACDNNADIISFAGDAFNQNGKVDLVRKCKYPNGFYDLTKKNIIIENLFPSLFDHKYMMNGAVWNKMIRKRILDDILDDLNPKLIGWGEDNVIIIGAVLKANSFFVMDECLYHHRERAGSAINKVHKDIFEQINYVLMNIEKFIKKHNNDKLVRKRFGEYAISKVIEGVGLYFYEEVALHYYLIPFKPEYFGAKFVIYGAGKVGVSYVHWEKWLHSGIKIVSWVDANKDGNNIEGMIISSPDQIKEIDYDYVLIAVKNEELATKIKAMLMDKVGVEDKKIIWDKPIFVLQALLENRN